VSPAEIRLTQPVTGGPYAGTFTVTAENGPVSYSISVPGTDLYLTITPAAGSLAAGQSQVITATLVPNPNGAPPLFDNPVTVNPGGIAVTLEYPPSG